MILGIETSATRASLAVLDHERNEIVWESAFETERAHNAAIFDPVEDMLKGFRDELTGIAVGLGPGSYGGIRVGIAVANGLSLVLGIPVRGVSSLEAWDVPGDSYTVLGDARRKTIFFAEVEGRVLAGDPDLVPEEEADERVERIREAGRMLVTADARLAERWEDVRLSFPTAEAVCRAAGDPAAGDPATGGGPADWPEAGPLEPHYLRAPYITTPKERG
jgi:tRNA threonylcarbamoyladenosine biosynthesis protein TsaB